MTDNICDIELIKIELNITKKDNVMQFLYKNFKKDIDYKIRNYIPNEYEKKHGGHNKIIHKLTDKTKTLIKQTYNLRNRDITETDNAKFINIVMNIESSTIGFICNIFKNILITKRQYYVGKYRVD